MGSFVSCQVLLKKVVHHPAAITFSATCKKRLHYETYRALTVLHASNAVFVLKCFGGRGHCWNDVPV